MKIALKISIFVFLFTISNTVISQESLKILTYNIQGMKPGTMPGIRLAFIMEKIILLDPDIIGLQEINESLDGDDNQCTEIADALSAYYNLPYRCYQQFTHLSWDNQYRESIGIVTKHPVIDSGFHQLATGVFPRKVVWNYIETPLGKVNFFNTHLSFNSSAVRLQQAGQIMEYTQDVIGEYPASATFLTGDFNDQPNTPTIQLLTNTESDTTFFDSYAIANPGSPGYTVPSNDPNKRIDYVFLSNISSLATDTSIVIPDSVIILDLYSSDHLGVMSTFTVDASGIGQKFHNRPNFELFQNHPNPVKNMTNIPYILNKSGHVKLSVFNQLGVEVAVIKNAFCQSGKYHPSFNTTKLPGGIYFYTLISDGFAQTKKMFVVK